jgi:DNA polymerase-3 subunit epsilon
MDGGGCFPTGRHYPGIAHLIRVAAVGVADEWPADLSMQELPLVCIDTETTGRDPAVDRVVEVGCVFFRRGQVQNRKSWLINPECPIPQEASDVHGIKDADVIDAPKFEQVAAELLKELAQAVPVAYNAQFDRDFLVAELGRVDLAAVLLPPAFRKGVEWLDPLIWARELQKEEKSKSVGEVRERHSSTEDLRGVPTRATAFGPHLRRGTGALAQ